MNNFLINSLKKLLVFFGEKSLPYKGEEPSIENLYAARQDIEKILGGFYLEAVHRAIQSGSEKDLAKAQQAAHTYEKFKEFSQNYYDTLLSKKKKAAEASQENVDTPET